MNEPQVTLSPEQSETLSQLARNANEQLETAGQDAANRAFNLSCSVGLLPAFLLALLAFILNRGNWVVAAVVSALAGVAILLFANLAAYTARTHTSQRIYQHDVQPEIERTLQELELTRSIFDRQVDQTLPGEAVLRNYLGSATITGEPGPDPLSEEH